MSHTPGPWRLGSDAQGPFIILHPTLDGVAIAACDDAYVPLNGFHSPTVEQPIPCKEAARGITYRPERVANARLIAAAPELLEACKAAVLQIEYLHAKFQATGSGEATVSRLRAAIAKAEGDK